MLGSRKVTRTETCISAVAASVGRISLPVLHKDRVKVSPTPLIWPNYVVSYGLPRSQLKSGHRLLLQRLKGCFIISGVIINGLGSPGNVYVSFLIILSSRKMFHGLLHLDGCWLLSLIPI